MNTTTESEILQRIIEGEAGRRAAEDIAREATAERIRLKTEIEKLKREHKEAKAENADDLNTTRIKLERAHAKFSEAQQAHQAAQARQAQRTAGFGPRIARLKNQLEASAPAVIFDFIKWLDDQAAEVRATKITTRSRATDIINTATDGLRREHYSNAKALTARLDAIHAARHEAERLQSLILDDDELTQRLEALRESLPAETIECDGIR